MKFNLGVAFLTCARTADIMRLLPDAAMVAIQHDVRAHYGWAYASDVDSATGLRNACNSHPNGQTLGWTAEQREETLETIVQRLRNSQHIVLVGAAAEEDDLERDWSENTVFIAADGAVGACFDRVEVLCVVTDLDGGEHLDEAVRRQIPLIVHAHGDNRFRWNQCLTEWAEQGGTPLVLTHQTDERYPDMHNTGGFTDGDRAACLLAAVGVPFSRVQFIGYAVDHVGPWSGATDPVRKLDKLRWMERILNHLHQGWSDRDGLAS